MTAKGLAAWQKRSSFWEVAFDSAKLSKSPMLCGTFCDDVEPGYESYGAPFNNLKALKGKTEIVLTGSVTIAERASIGGVDVTVWVCPGSSRIDVSCAKGIGGFTDDTPHPIPVGPGDQVLFTLDLKVSRGRG